MEKLLTHKEVAGRLAMSPQALRMALYRGHVALQPIYPEASQRKAILYLESEVEGYIAGLAARRRKVG